MGHLYSLLCEVSVRAFALYCVCVRMCACVCALLTRSSVWTLSSLEGVLWIPVSWWMYVLWYFLLVCAWSLLPLDVLFWRAVLFLISDFCVLSEIFVYLKVKFRSRTNFSFIFVQSMRWGVYFSLVDTQLFHTIPWKDFLFLTGFLWHLCQKSVHLHMSQFLGSLSVFPYTSDTLSLLL